MRTSIFLFLGFIIFFSINAFAQEQSNASISQNILTQNSNPVYFIGFDTGVSDNFIDILETLRGTKGINVLSFCEKNNIIKLSFNENVFIELTSIFDMIENSYREVICYHMKHYTHDKYYDMCYDELLKRDMGGIE